MIKENAKFISLDRMEFEIFIPESVHYVTESILVQDLRVGTSLHPEHRSDTNRNEFKHKLNDECLRAALVTYVKHAYNGLVSSISETINCY